MKFVLKPSLEHMALAKIGISLWNQNNVRALISKLYESPPFTMDLPLRAWEKIEKSVVKKVSLLSLPQSLKEKVFGVIKPIGIEIFQWMQYYRKYVVIMEFEYYLDLDFPSQLPAELCWTPQGTVDRKRTAEVLVKDENLNIWRRYILACDHFLEDDDIIRFWNSLPEDLKEYDWNRFPVISFWSDKMKGVGAGHISYKDAFYSSVGDSNKIAAKYFLQNLTPQERDECLENLAIYLEDADVLCFLLPEMEEEEQKKVLIKNPHRVLQFFLLWPWQNFFIRVANCMWDFLLPSGYDLILEEIIRKVRERYKDYNYQNLFADFWQKSPHALKDSLIDEIDDSWILLCLLDIKDKENVRFILKDANLTAKEKLIYSKKISSYLACCIRFNEWDFLEFFIRECLPSENEMLKFKKEFEKLTYFKYFSASEKHKWNQSFGASDDSICKHGKRSVEEGESSSSEQFESLQ